MKREVVIACSGPSLNAVSIDIGCPVAAISTAIRTVTMPDYWIFMDRPTANYGPDHGGEAMRNKRIRKVTVTEHKNLKVFPNVTLVNRKDVARQSFNDATFGLSVLFAVQWLVSQRFTKLIFAGCDLVTDPKQPYAHGGKMVHGAAAIQNNGHHKVFETLKAWHLVAKEMGVDFLCHTPNSPLLKFMPEYSLTEAIA